MQILDNIIIIALPVIAFIAGMKISDRYNNETIRELQYQLRLNAAKSGVGYIAPPKRNVSLGEEFMQRLKTNGKAVQKLR